MGRIPWNLITFLGGFAAAAIAVVVTCALSSFCSDTDSPAGYREPIHSDMSGLKVVFVTVPSIEVGKKIGHGLVSSKLAACVNIVPQITSIYEWGGKIEEDSELLLMIKTQNQHFEELEHFVKSNHPYDTPEVIGLPIEQGSKKYLDWIRQVTNREATHSVHGEQKTE